MSEYPLSDPNNPQPQPGDAPQQAAQIPPVTNTPPTPVTTAPSQNNAPSQSQPTQQAPQPAQASQPSSTVSNTPAPVHPSVQKAGILRQVAEALAGGPRYTTAIDPNTGATTRTRVPLSSRDIGMAIALEAISGGIAGLAQRGPGATGRAAAAGFDTVAAQRQQADQQQEQQAQADANNRAQAVVRQAQAFASAQHARLNTMQAERYGVESLKDAVNINGPLLASYQDEGAVSESNVTQDDLMSGLQSGKYNVTREIAIPDGFTNVGGKYEQTFAIVNNPSAKIPLTSEQAKVFADAGIPGWQAFKTSKVPEGYTISGSMLAIANAQLQAIGLMKQEFSQVTDALSKSDDKNNQELAKSLPNISDLLNDPNNGGPLLSALLKAQKFVSHSDWHGMDLYQSLQQMAAPSKLDPSGKQYVPNPDANAAQVIASAYGNGDPQKGWAILKAYHAEVTPEPIKNESDAASVIANNAPGSRPYKIAQQWITTNNAQKAAQARADAQARAAVQAATNAAASGQPDAFGFTPNVAAMGGVKEYNKRVNSFKKNLDDLARTEASYQQFGDTLQSIANGNPMTGAQSVVALFNAIGLSATPLAGRGFRITENTIREHEQARGWGQAIQAKLLNAKAGDVITPQQLKDYADIAVQARQSQYVNLFNEMRSAGLAADAALPTGNGQHIDVPTARIFLTLAGNDANKARAAATAKGWQF